MIINVAGKTETTLLHVLKLREAIDVVLALYLAHSTVVIGMLLPLNVPLPIHYM